MDSNGRKTRVIVTPELAAEFLALNGQNRPLSQITVGQYAAVMSAGLWHYNPMAPIGFDGDGILLDGQHRLQAVVKSGTTQVFDVCRGVERGLFHILDTGRKRSAADALAVRGEENQVLLSAALQLIVRDRQAHERASMGRAYRIQPIPRVLHGEILDALDANPGIRNSLPLHSSMIKPRRLITSSVFVWLHYRFSRVDPEAADTFFRAVGTGERLVPKSPELVLRVWLTNNLGYRRRALQEIEAAVIVKAWNKSRRGEPVGVLKWNSAEDFPSVEGETSTP